MQLMLIVNYRYVHLNPMMPKLVKELVKWKEIFEECPLKYCYKR